MKHPVLLREHLQTMIKSSVGQLTCAVVKHLAMTSFAWRILTRSWFIESDIKQFKQKLEDLELRSWSNKLSVKHSVGPLWVHRSERLIVYGMAEWNRSLLSRLRSGFQLWLPPTALTCWWLPSQSPEGHFASPAIHVVFDKVNKFFLSHQYVYLFRSPTAP